MTTTDYDYNELIENLQKQIGLPKDFFWKLLKEDDWSFVIKLHAFVEAVVTHLIIKKISLNQLEEIISNLELSNSKSGRLAFLKALNLIPRWQSFIKRLSEIRNDFVHDVKKVNLTLESYFKQCSKEKIKNDKKLFGDSKVKYMNRSLEKIFNASPKTAIFITFIGFLMNVCLDNLNAQSYNEKLKKALELSEGPNIGKYLEKYLK